MVVRAVMGLAAAVLAAGCSVIGIQDEEAPRYQVLMASEAFEVRRYEPRLVAEVDASGPGDAARRDAFRILANFIFGGNQTSTSVAMTVPVDQVPASTKIAMTVPVDQIPGETAWTMRFGMPSEFTAETLPKPNDPRIRILTTDAHVVAVRRLSGWGSTERLTAVGAAMTQDLAAAGIQVAGPARFAFWNPPWTLPPLRRIEVIVPLSDDQRWRSAQAS